MKKKDMMYGKGGSKMPKSVYKKGGSKMSGLKAMYKSLSPEQKKEMMSARYGMEKPLNQMGHGGMLDMSVPMEMKMRYGGDMMKKMKAMQMDGKRYGGGTASTYSGPKKRKK